MMTHRKMSKMWIYLKFIIFLVRLKSKELNLVSSCAIRHVNHFHGVTAVDLFGLHCFSRFSFFCSFEYHIRGPPKSGISQFRAPRRWWMGFYWYFRKRERRRVPHWSFPQGVAISHEFAATYYSSGMISSYNLAVIFRPRRHAGT